ncbi:Uncharacterized protein Rs2_26680 [Raphanus sativus]|nr:Uncharacterized protein Rs2_26680 [Raphanus sativus]
MLIQVWFGVRLSDVVLLREHLLSLPRSCVFLVGLLASQWFCPSGLLLRGGGHSSVGRWLSLGCECPCVRVGGLRRRFPRSEFKVFILCLILVSVWLLLVLVEVKFLPLYLFFLATISAFWSLVEFVRFTLRFVAV